MKTIKLTIRSFRQLLLLILAGFLASQLASAQNSFSWSGADLVKGNTNWSDYANWYVNSPGDNAAGNWPGTDGAGDAVYFLDLGSVAFSTRGNPPTLVNNTVDATTTVAELEYNLSVTNTWHVTGIPAGITLTASNLVVGGFDDDAGENSYVAFIGGGTLLVNGLGNGAAADNQIVSIGNGATGNSGGSIQEFCTLDLTGLTNFVFNSSQGEFALSGEDGTSGDNSKQAANLKLAAVSNSITAEYLYLSQIYTGSGASATTNLVLLGPGTNIFNATEIDFGCERTSGKMSFLGASGGLRIRGVDGTDNTLANLYVSRVDYNGGSSGFTDNSSISLYNHPVDLKFNTLYLGQNNDSGYNSKTPGTAFACEQATFSFGGVAGGSVYATSIVLGQTSKSSSEDVAALGTLNVSTNGVLTVGSSGITMVGATSTLVTTNIANLNVTNATLTLSNSIVKVPGKGSDSYGTGIYKASIALIRSTFMMANTNGLVGASAAPIDSLTIGDSTVTVPISLNQTSIVATVFNNASVNQNTINISSFPTIAHYPTTYALLSSASGSIGNFVLGTLPAASPVYQGHLQTSGNMLQFVLTSGPAPAIQTLVWNGNLSGNWDTSTANWEGGLFYNQGDYVTFDDTLRGTTNVYLTTALAPGSLTVSNNANLYMFGRSGLIGGSVTLNKFGTNALVFANSTNNTFSGGLSITAGIVQLTNYDDLLPTNGIVSLANANSAALDLNNQNQTLGALTGGGAAGGNVTLGLEGLNTLTIIGGGGAYYGGISGNGAVAVAGGGSQILYGANTYTNGTTIYASSTLAVANTSGSATGPGPITINTGGTLQIGDTTTAGSVAAATIYNNNGTINFNGLNSIMFTNQVNGGGAFNQKNNNVVTLPYAQPNYFGGTVDINGGAFYVLDSSSLGVGTPVTVEPAAASCLELGGGINLSQNIAVIAKNAFVPSLLNVTGTNIISGALSLNQNGNYWIFSSQAGSLTLSATGDNSTSASKYNVWLTGAGNGEWDGTLSGSGGMIKDGAGSWVLGGAQYTYASSTLVSNGTLVVNGELQNSSVTVYSGGTLRGGGVETVGGGLLDQNVVVNGGGALAPGDAGNLGALTIGGNLTLSGTTTMRVSLNSGNDSVNVNGTISLGGTLDVTLVDSVTNGETFILFTAGTFGGSFRATNLPALPGGLAWDTSNLGTGVLAVVSGGSPTLNFTQSGGVLGFSWTGLYKLQSQTNALNNGLKANWNDYPGGGSSPVNVTIDPAAPAVFFRLSTP